MLYKVRPTSGSGGGAEPERRGTPCGARAVRVLLAAVERAVTTRGPRPQQRHGNSGDRARARESREARERYGRARAGHPSCTRIKWWPVPRVDAASSAHVITTWALGAARQCARRLAREVAVGPGHQVVKSAGAGVHVCGAPPRCRHRIPSSGCRGWAGLDARGRVRRCFRSVCPWRTSSCTCPCGTPTRSPSSLALPRTTTMAAPPLASPRASTPRAASPPTSSATSGYVLQLCARDVCRRLRRRSDQPAGIAARLGCGRAKALRPQTAYAIGSATEATRLVTDGAVMCRTPKFARRQMRESHARMHA